MFSPTIFFHFSSFSILIYFSFTPLLRSSFCIFFCPIILLHFLHPPSQFSFYFLPSTFTSIFLLSSTILFFSPSSYQIFLLHLLLSFPFSSFFPIFPLYSFSSLLFSFSSIFFFLFPLILSYSFFLLISLDFILLFSLLFYLPSLFFSSFSHPFSFIFFSSSDLSSPSFFNVSFIWLHHQLTFAFFLYTV